LLHSQEQNPDGFYPNSRIKTIILSNPDISSSKINLFVGRGNPSGNLPKFDNHRGREL
jgi:hypothetical protein